MNAIRTLLLGFILSSSLYASFEGSKGENSFLEEASFFVTAEEFCSFLNEVAAGDPHSLYEKTNERIIRCGEPGSYHYEVIQGEEKKPLSFLSKHDAMRYSHWKSTSQKFTQKMENKKSNDGNAAAMEQKTDELDNDALLQENNDGIFLLLSEQPNDSSLNMDPLLRSSEISVHLSSQDFLLQASSAPGQDSTSWNNSKILIGALITIGTLFGEDHFSLEEARRSGPGASTDHPLNHQIESRCYSEEAVLESLKAHDPVTRLQAEQKLLKKQDRSNPLIDEAVDLETKLQDVASTTVLGQMNKTRAHLTQGAGHLLHWGFYALSPLLDNARRITAAGSVAYGLGALTHGSSLALVSNGNIGTYVGDLAVGGNGIHDTYNNWSDYRNVLGEHYDEMKKSFAAASTSFKGAWTLKETKKSAEEARRAFYQKQWSTYSSEDSFSPEHARLLLEAKAHEVIEAATETAKTKAFHQFMAMGRNFFGSEMMEHAAPQKDQAKILSNFNDEKDLILAKIRCAYVSVEKQWQIENLQKELEKVEKDLRNQAEKVIKVTVESRDEALEAFHQFIKMGEDFYGLEIMEDTFPEGSRTIDHFKKEKGSILGKMKLIQVPRQEDSSFEGVQKELEEVKKDLHDQAEKVITALAESKNKPFEAFHQFMKMGEDFYGLEIMEDIFPEESRTALLHNFIKEKKSILGKMKLIQIPVRQWDAPSDGVQKELERIESKLHHRARNVIREETAKGKMKAFECFIREGESFCGLDAIEHILADFNQKSLLFSFSDKKDTLIARVKSVYGSMAKQHQKLLEYSKKTPLEIETLRSFTPTNRLNSLANHTEELKNHASHEVEKFNSEGQPDFLKDLTKASGHLVGEAAVLGLKALTMSTLGFVTGSFIGHEFAASFFPGDLCRSWIGENSTGAAYGAYFFIVGLKSQNTLHISAQRTASAWAHINEIWNRSYQQKIAQEKLAFANETYRCALQKHSCESVEAGQKEAATLKATFDEYLSPIKKFPPITHSDSMDSHSDKVTVVEGYQVISSPSSSTASSSSPTPLSSRPPSPLPPPSIEHSPNSVATPFKELFSEYSDCGKGLPTSGLASDEELPSFKNSIRTRERASTAMQRLSENPSRGLGLPSPGVEGSYVGIDSKGPVKGPIFPLPFPPKVQPEGSNFKSLTSSIEGSFYRPNSSAMQCSQKSSLSKLEFSSPSVGSSYVKVDVEVQTDPPAGLLARSSLLEGSLLNEDDKSLQSPSTTRATDDSGVFVKNPLFPRQAQPGDRIQTLTSSIEEVFSKNNVGPLDQRRVLKNCLNESIKSELIDRDQSESFIDDFSEGEFLEETRWAGLPNNHK